LVEVILFHAPLLTEDPFPGLNYKLLTSQAFGPMRSYDAHTRVPYVFRGVISNVPYETKLVYYLLAGFGTIDQLAQQAIPMRYLLDNPEMFFEVRQ
jgi:hypothetical protein